MNVERAALNGNTLGVHAIVIGGSLAGLFAARVLSEHVAQVTVLEQDHFPAPGQTRKGVPQGRHSHGLLAGGFRAMETLFPGFGAALLEAGALPFDAIGDARYYQFGGYKARFASGLRGLLMSRPLIETVVRQQTLALPNVRAIEGCDVRALLADTERTRIRGVRFERSKAEETLLADVVVDASGRGSRSPAWLEALGYPRPPIDEIRIGMGYTTRIYRRKPHDLDGDLGAATFSTPPHAKRCGFMLAIEDDRWTVSLGGWLGDHAPVDEQGFLAFARSLPAPDIYDVIRQAEPLSDGVVHKVPSNLRRRYERLARFPDGYLVVGDALCSFNPIYGQGMTAAALEALTLRDCLNEHRRLGGLAGLSHGFFKRAAKVVDTPWSMATGEDFRFPDVQGKRAPGTALLHRYMNTLHRVAGYDPVVCRAFFEVAHFLTPPASLFRPAIMLRVLKGRLSNHHVPAQTPPLPALGS